MFVKSWLVTRTWKWSSWQLYSLLAIREIIEFHGPGRIACSFIKICIFMLRFFYNFCKSSPDKLHFHGPAILRFVIPEPSYVGQYVLQQLKKQSCTINVHWVHLAGPVCWLHLCWRMEQIDSTSFPYSFECHHPYQWCIGFDMTTIRSWRVICINY